MAKDEEISKDTYTFIRQLIKKIQKDEELWNARTIIEYLESLLF